MTTFTKDINLSGSAKLEECRALGSKVSEVVFAPGAPLKIIHLPNTVISLELTQATELTKILTSKPVVGTWNEDTWEFTYNDPSTYTGLYLEDITDNVIAGNGHKLNRLNIDGSGLNYNLYTILDNLVTIKTGALADNKLQISLKQIDWTPYKQVPYGEAQGTGPYYRLNDHSMYDEYTSTDADLWNELTLNGRIYTKDETRPISTITSLALLDKFIDDYRNTTNGINQFTNTAGSVNKTYPTLAGEMFVNNTADTAIDEFQLTDTYGTIWPDLIIRAAYVNEAYLAKYVQVLDSGKEDEVDVIRYEQAPGTTVTLTSKIPAKQYYDFKGWALDKQGTNMVASYNEASKTCDLVQTVTFDDDHKEYTLYAIFEQHPYNVTFYDVDGSTVLAVTTATYGRPAVDPGISPSTDESVLPMDRTYKFKGYSRTLVPIAGVTDRVIRENVVDVGTIIVTRDISFYAVYKEQSVYDEPTDESYFEMTAAGIHAYVDEYPEDGDYNIARGCIIRPVADNIFAGKITIPSTFNGVPVFGITGFAAQPRLTHLFFYDNGVNFRRFEAECFSQLNATEPAQLRWVQWPETTRFMGNYAFYNCVHLILSEDFNHMHLYGLGDNAMNRAFGTIQEGMTKLKFSGNLRYTGTLSMAYLTVGNLSQELEKLNRIEVQFGDSNDPSLFQLTTKGISRRFLDQNNCMWKSMAIYCDDSRYSELSGLNASNNTIWYEWVNQYMGYFITWQAGTSQINSCPVYHA